MRIDFERSGGFAGMILRATIDTGDLPEADANDLRQLIEEANFFALPPTITSASGADQFTYRLTVIALVRQHSVEVSDGAAPDTLRPLLNRLTTLARANQRSQR
ncbi:MAG: hypothetical protein IT324_01105 [Anaerolineae bacterium]|nr:hypothetical protein [Anaerolineae bacterium]